MPKARINDIHINYEIHGEGKPLILISGLGYSLRQWYRIVPILAKHFQVIVFDNRGVGLSDKPNLPYSAELLAKDTVCLLDYLNINKAIIIGHSMGGFIAQSIAINYPKKVEKLVLCSTHFGGTNHIPITPEAMKILSDTSLTPAERLKNGLSVSVKQGWVKNNKDIINDWIDWKINNPIDEDSYSAQLAIGLNILNEKSSFEQYLHAINFPTLILFGRYDKITPPENAFLFQKIIKDSKVSLLEEAGHFLPIEVPGIMANKIIEFAL